MNIRIRRTRGTRIAGPLAGALLAIPAMLAFAAPAHADTCSGTSGTSVVVDFGDKIETGCAEGTPESGVDALKAAGFELTFVSGQGFICKINDFPADQACDKMAPATAFWGYFHADRGGKWAFSKTGADAAPAQVEGWSFGKGDAPKQAAPTGNKTPSAAASADEQADKTAADGDKGDGVPWIWGVVLVAVLAVAAAAVTVNRRRA